MIIDNDLTGNTAGLDPHGIICRSGGTVQARNAAQQGLRDFVLVTWAALVADAEGIFNAPSPVRDFVRIDVGFMPKANGAPGFDYFVNEVELGGSGVCMFSQNCVAGDRVADELLEQMKVGLKRFHDANRRTASKPRGRQVRFLD